MCDVGIGERASVFYANMIGDDPGNMSLDLLRRVLDSAMEFRPLPRIGLAFTEPLNHVHILDFCREIKARGFFCSITSNGYMLPKRAEALVEIGVDELTISVDGPAEVHDAIRGRKGSFAHLYEGIELVNQAKAARQHCPACAYPPPSTTELRPPRAARAASPLRAAASTSPTLVSSPTRWRSGTMPPTAASFRWRAPAWAR